MSQWFRAFYLGLTMLSTVGYGDVTPVSLGGVVVVRLYVVTLNMRHRAFGFHIHIGRYSPVAMLTGHPSHAYGRTDLLLHRCQTGRLPDALHYQYFYLHLHMYQGAHLTLIPVFLLRNCVSVGRLLTSVRYPTTHE